ncbi:DNA cytosine methyltransferase [Tumidithrix helvetica PCC 7403]
MTDSLPEIYPTLTLPLQRGGNKIFGINQERPIAVDLFAGAGGMTLGFEQAGFDVLASVEIDPIHCATHKYNFPFWEIICQSATDISAAEIRRKAKIGDRSIDVVFGGPPCQGFSMMGKRALDDPRNHLVFHFLRLVLELQPKYFVMENVKGLTVGKHKQFLAEIMAEFESQGYQIEQSYRVLNACHYGVPQHRERLFLLGCRQGLELPKYPAPITKPAKASKIPKELADLPPSPTVWEAIADLPSPDRYAELLRQDWCEAEFDLDANFNPSDYVRRLRSLDCSTQDYSYPRHFDRKLLTSSIRTHHSLESMARFHATPQGKTEPISRFLKLDPQGICNTLRAGTASNHGAFTSPRPIHPFEPRCITVREAARLHSYPDWFRFHATKWHGFRQIGNSVPPLLAQAVATEIRKALKVTPVKPQVMQQFQDPALLRIKMTEAARKYGVDRHVIAPRTRPVKVEVMPSS